MPDLVITITIPAAERADAIAAALHRLEPQEGDTRTDEELATFAIQAQVGRFLGAWHQKRQDQARGRPPRFGTPDPPAPPEPE